jgi:hypothetical protein
MFPKKVLVKVPAEKVPKGEEEHVLSFLNPFGDGMEIQMFDEG